MIDQIYIDQISDIAIKAVVDEWIKQGHSLTKKFERTIERKVVESTGKTVLEFYVQDYAVVQNKGVAASRIPYTKGSGRKTSKYIDGLIKYALQRMTNSRQEAERIAFAIASKHKREGMQTNASKRFSSTGKRKGFIGDGLKKVENKIDIIIRIAITATFERIIQIGTNDRITA